MTSEEIIQAIRNEIEKQIKDPLEYCYGVSSINKLRELLDFISTLESEKPTNQEGLEEEIERYLHSLGVGYGSWVDGMDDDDLRGIARHFAEWGAEHLKK